jgi:hypothetical protein
MLWQVCSFDSRYRGAERWAAAYASCAVTQFLASCSDNVKGDIKNLKKRLLQDCCTFNPYGKRNVQYSQTRAILAHHKGHKGQSSSLWIPINENNTVPIKENNTYRLLTMENNEKITRAEAGSQGRGKRLWKIKKRRKEKRTNKQQKVADKYYHAAICRYRAYPYHTHQSTST